MECLVLRYFKSHEPDICGRTLLAMRISLKAGWDNLRKFFTSQVSHPTQVSHQNGDQLKFGFNEDGVFANDYLSVYHMATNKKLRAPSTNLDYALAACVTINILESAKLLDKILTMQAPGHLDKMHNNEQAIVQQEGRKIFAASLVHHMQAIQCNAYGIVESDMPSDSQTGFKTQKAIYVGLGLYPTLGLLNHSCDPILDVSFHGNTAVYRCFSNLRAGEQITIDYGPIYYDRTKVERQRHLKENYYFDCHCDACNGDWPLLDEIDTRIPTFKCINCQKPFAKGVDIQTLITCLNCKHQCDLISYLKELGISHGYLSTAMEDVKNGRVLEALPVLRNHLGLMQEIIAPPWKEWISCQSAIDQCYRKMTPGSKEYSNKN